MTSHSNLTLILGKKHANLYLNPKPGAIKSDNSLLFQGRRSGKEVFLEYLTKKKLNN